MTVSQLLTRDCTITHRTTGGTVDAYGDEIATTATTTTVCELQQQQRMEDTALGTTVRDVWLLVLPGDTTIGPDDTVTVDGVDYQVSGDPWPVRNPRTAATSHIEATVRRGTGVDA